MYVIIQPTTFERNLSGICYMPYWIYVALEQQGHASAEIYEDVTAVNADEIFKKHGKSSHYLIDISNYPQIDLAQQIWRRHRNEHNIYFIGYKPLIRKLNLPFFTLPEDKLLQGVWKYIYYLDKFSSGLLSDCDAHLTAYDTDKTIVPLYLNIGCRRRCPYCYTGFSNYPYGEMELGEARKALDYVNSRNWNVHFCDDNFYRHTDIVKIIEHLQDKYIKWICLTDTVTLTRIERLLGSSLIAESGNILNEVGLETIDEKVLSKKQNITSLLNSPLNIFWLTMTFLPNDTIKSLNNTGDFLLKHGYSFDEVVPRIRTNSTVGGLGQFFQTYDGTPFCDTAKKSGRILSDRPARLWPSYVGNEFLAEVPHANNETIVDKRWYTLYGTEQGAEDVLAMCNGTSTIEQLLFKSPYDMQTTLVYLAQLARLKVIV